MQLGRDVSYSSKDEEFARRLYNDLQANNVRCWSAPEDLKIGDKFWERIDASIRVYNKLLVILSAQAVASDWVEDEVTRALDRERQQPGRLVLFPIRLDDAVLTATPPWASGLHLKRHIGNFCSWKDHDAYQAACCSTSGHAGLAPPLTPRLLSAILPARMFPSWKGAPDPCARPPRSLASLT